MATRFVKNDAGFKEMAVGEELRAAVLAVAEKGRAAAEALAADFAVTGDYLASFDTFTSISFLETGFGSHPVVTGVLQNHSDHAAAVEWGNANDHKPHRVLGHTLDTLDS